jgi:hypothetical protein
MGDLDSRIYNLLSNKWAGLTMRSASTALQPGISVSLLLIIKKKKRPHESTMKNLNRLEDASD